MLQQTLARLLPDARNFQQFARAVAHLPPLAVERHRKAMRFIAHHLHYVQYWRVMVNDYRLALLPEDIDHFFPLGDRRQRLVGDLQRLQRFGGGMQLPDAAIDQHQAGHLLIFRQHAFVSAAHNLAHGGKIIHPGDAANDELAVVGFFHLAFFPHHHRGHGFGALNVGNIEALDARGQRRQLQRVLQRLLHDFHLRLQYAEALLERLLGIARRQIHQRTLLSTLRNQNFDPPFSPLR